VAYQAPGAMSPTQALATAEQCREEEDDRVTSSSDVDGRCRSLSLSPTKKIQPHHSQRTSTRLPPIAPTAQGSLSVEERQSRQMRSFLQNFLSDDRGRFHDVLDLCQHALDTGITVTDATIQEVVNTVPAVKGLRLTGCPAITDAGIWAIARQCTQLDTIYLAGCERVTDLGLRLLAHNCRLLTIDLSDCPQVTDAILQTLAAGCWMLQTFILQRSRRVSDAGIVKIAQCCKDLRHLDFSECEHVGEYGDKALLEIGRYCSQLRVLDLFGCRHVQDIGVQAIARGCPRLTTLKLTGCQGVSSVAVRALAKQCPLLEILSLAGCIKTTNDDVAELARNCSRLHWLDISGSPSIDATGIHALALYCHHLTYLNLSHCRRLNDAALLELAGEKTCSRTMLTHLSVANCPRITERGVELLTNACPNMLTMDMTECDQVGRRFLQKLVQKLEFVEWASTFFGFQPLPNAAELCRARDRRLLEQKSATKLQALMRGCLARGGVWQAKLRYVERKWLPRIQARIRGFLVRKRLAAEAYDRRKRAAALFILETCRNWRLRRLLARHRRVLRIRRNEEAAAVIFQKVFRGHRDRKKVQAMRDDIQRRRQLDARIHAMLELAAIKVQRAYRGHVGRADASIVRAARDAQRRQQEKEVTAAQFLQRVYRGHQGRRRRAARLAELLHEKQQHAGAVKLQKVFRGHKGRRNALCMRLHVEQLRRIDAAMTIQRHWRGLKDKHLAAVLIGLVKLRAREHTAAHTIQRAYRMYASRGFLKAMRLAQQLQRRRLCGAMTIQRMVRGHRGRANAEVQRELRKLEVVAQPLFRKRDRLQSVVSDLAAKVQSLQHEIESDERDEALLALELEKTMQIKTKYHDSSRITGTPQRYLTQYLQVQLADQLRAKRVELAMETHSLEVVETQWSDAQKQLRAVTRELEPLTVGVIRQTNANRVQRLQTKVRRERVAATLIQKIFRGFRIRCVVREGANCWLELPVPEEQAASGRTVYYYNAFTGESRWRKPLAMSIFHDGFLKPLPVDRATTSSGSTTTNWYEAYDEHVGQRYYYNPLTKEYQWERPDSLSPDSAYLTDSQSSRKRREWLRDRQDDGELELLIAGSQLRCQLGEWEHRVDPLSECWFFYHPPTAELRVSLSPRSVHRTIAGVVSTSFRRSARSVTTTSPRPMLWQYRYGYEVDPQGDLVRVDSQIDDGVERPIWTEHMDETSGVVPYYYNHITQEYRWEKPAEFGLGFEAYASTTNSSREWFRSQQQQQQEEIAASTAGWSGRSTQQLLTERSQKVRALGRKWVECMDPESGNSYYYNEISGETRWSLSPRSARDDVDLPGEIPMQLYEQVKRLREAPIMYTARGTHMSWLDDAMDNRDWTKVDVLVQQIGIREQSKAVEDARIDRQRDMHVLPPGWSLFEDPVSGQSYYYNAISGETSWAAPSSDSR
jgi:hypothetical protein